MNTLTLFSAYVKATIRCESIVLQREKFDWGIMVDSDAKAKQWQRYNRLAVRLECELVKRLTEKNCEWTYHDEDWDYWETHCGKAFTLDSGTPEENDMVFCTYCGQEIAITQQHPL